MSGTECSSQIWLDGLLVRFQRQKLQLVLRFSEERFEKNETQLSCKVFAIRMHINSNRKTHNITGNYYHGNGKLYPLFKHGAVHI